MRDIVMPRLGLTMEEGTVNAWKIQPGTPFKEGEIILEILSDKATVDVEAPFSGTLVRILVNDGETVPVGTPIGQAEEPPA
jgi:pyruvate dehydrogenase E2 component (dihydrolipoamide acetyltransferase)